ncbi:head-tail adaptor protein [Streptomyces sp. NPDC005248]|uniref:head-tail adaptor protein n=1 Tax=Streptomyces sp. NPDC005248 TaxID=3364709 RepID=UPI0036CF6439
MSRASRLLRTPVEVWRNTKVPDGMGGWINTTAKVADARARLSQPSAAERTVADQTTARLTHVAYLPAGADVRRSDELRQGARRLTVLATFEPSEPGTYLRADCEQIQPGI